MDRIPDNVLGVTAQESSDMGSPGQGRGVMAPSDKSDDLVQSLEHIWYKKRTSSC